MSILNPKKILDQCTKEAANSLIAQNGIDIPISKIYRLDSTTPGHINGGTRTFPKRVELELVGEEYILYPGFYEFTTDIEIAVPSNMAGLIIPRSSFLRMGAWVGSGLWDSGFSGKLSGFINNTTCLVSIGKNERVGQFLMFEAEAFQLYSGMYQNSGSTLDVQKLQKPR